MELLKKFLREYNLYYCKLLVEPNMYIFVHVDESFIHTHHSQKISIISATNPCVDRSIGRGNKLLIIIYAITQDGHLCEYDESNIQLDHL